jgi:hypothetical protein
MFERIGSIQVRRLMSEEIHMADEVDMAVHA